MAWHRFQNSNKSFVFNVDQDYESGGDRCPGMGAATEFNGLHFRNLTVTHAPSGLEIGHITCDIGARCDDITIDKLKFIDVPNPYPLTCDNIHGSQRNVEPPENSRCKMDSAVSFV